MRVIVLVMISVMLLGCASQQAADESGGGDIAGGGQAGQPAVQTRVNTSGIYFERNVSDVMNANTTFPEVKNITYDFSNMTTGDGRLIVYYFHSSACSACKALRPDIDRLEAKYPDVLWLEYDLVDDEGHNAYNQFAAQRNLTVQQMYVPQALVNGTVITDIFNINQSLEGIIKNFGAG